MILGFYNCIWIWGLQTLKCFWQSCFSPSLEEESATAAVFTAAEKHPKPKYESSLSKYWQKIFSKHFYELIFLPWSSVLSFHFRSERKQKRNVCSKSNSSWLGSVMRVDSVSAGLQIKCRSALLDKSQCGHHHLAQYLSCSALGALPTVDVLSLMLIIACQTDWHL